MSEKNLLKDLINEVNKNARTPRKINYVLVISVSVPHVTGGHINILFPYVNLKDFKRTARSGAWILFQNGFVLGNTNAVDSFCEHISKLNYEEAKHRLSDGTFFIDQ